MIQIPLNQVWARQAASVQSQMLTVPASSNEVRVSHGTSVRQIIVAKRISNCDESSRFLRQSWWRTSTHIQRHTRMSAHSDHLSRRKKKKIEEGVGQHRYPCTAGVGRVGQRRVVLVPPEGTPETIQDRQQSSAPTRRLVLVNSQQPEPSVAVITRMTQIQRGAVPKLMKERQRWTTVVADFGQTDWPISMFYCFGQISEPKKPKPGRHKDPQSDLNTKPNRKTPIWAKVGLATKSVN